MNTHINETDKRYLQSDFLDTAGFIKATLPSISVSYLDQVSLTNPDVEILKRANIRVKSENRERQINSIITDVDYTPLIVEETDEYKEYLASDTKDKFGIQLKSVAIYNKIVTIPKEKTALKDYLTNVLFNKYMELSKLNDKSIKTIAQPPVNSLKNKIRKYVYGNNNFVFDDLDENAIKKLVIKIMECSNIIAQYSRRGPASFIIIHPYLMKYMEYIPGFMSYNNTNNSIDKIDKIGSFYGLEIFINTKQDKNLCLIGRKAYANGPDIGVIISEYTTEILENTIEWRGAVFSVGNTSQYMYDTFKVEFTSNLSWFKRFLFKKFLK